MGHNIANHPCADASFRFYDDTEDGKGVTMETEIDVVRGREDDAKTWVRNHLGDGWAIEEGDLDNSMRRFFLSANVTHMTVEEIVTLQQATFEQITSAPTSIEAKGLPFFQPVYVYC